MAEASTEPPAWIRVRPIASGAGIDVATVAIDGLHQVRLHPWEPDAELLTCASFGFATFPAVGRVAQSGSRRLLALGPDEWLIIGDTGNAGAATAVPALVINAADGYSSWLLQGPRAWDVLSKGCAIDFSPDRFDEGTCVRTLLFQVPCVLVGWGGAVLVLAEAPFADYLSHALTDATLEYQDMEGDR